MTYVSDKDKTKEVYHDIVHRSPYRMRQNIVTSLNLWYFVLAIVAVFLYGYYKAVVGCISLVLVIIWAILRPSCYPPFIEPYWKKEVVDVRDSYLAVTMVAINRRVSYLCAYCNIERVVYNKEMRRLEIYGKFDRLKRKGTGEATPKRADKVFIYESIQDFDELRKVVEEKVEIANRSNTAYALQERMDKFRSMRSK